MIKEKKLELMLFSGALFFAGATLFEGGLQYTNTRNSVFRECLSRAPEVTRKACADADNIAHDSTPGYYTFFFQTLASSGLAGTAIWSLYNTLKKKD